MLNKGMNETPFYASYGKVRRFLYDVCTNKYFDLAITAVIGLNVLTMALEFHKMPEVSFFFIN